MAAQIYYTAQGAGSRPVALLSLALSAWLLTGCWQGPKPRSYIEFMEDSYAREGTLARCNQDREATAEDAECVSARRAAATLAAREHEALREEREALSEARRAAARDRAGSIATATQQAQAVAQAEAEAEYEAQWSDSEILVQADPAPAEVPEHITTTYGSLASTLETPGATAYPRQPEPAPSLDFIELPPSASMALPYVEIPASVQRRELDPAPALQGVSIPDSVAYRD